MRGGKWAASAALAGLTSVCPAARSMKCAKRHPEIDDRRSTSVLSAAAMGRELHGPAGKAAEISAGIGRTRFGRRAAIALIVPSAPLRYAGGALLNFSFVLWLE